MRPHPRHWWQDGTTFHGYNITAGNEDWLATQMDNAANVNYRMQQQHLP